VGLAIGDGRAVLVPGRGLVDFTAYVLHEPRLVRAVGIMASRTGSLAVVESWTCVGAVRKVLRGRGVTVPRLAWTPDAVLDWLTEHGGTEIPMV